ncbi:MAG: c-type cytochrome [Gammaproteobacteria bacterium]
MRILVVVAAVIGAACFGIGGAWAAAPPHSSKHAAQLLAQGRYLVTRAAPCADCHTPRNAHGQSLPGRALQGAPIDVSPLHPVPGWANQAPSIAGLPQGWSFDQAVHFLETGVTPGGGQAGPPMPQFRFNAQDARAIATYLQSLPKPSKASTDKR